MDFGWNSEDFPALSDQGDTTPYAVDATDVGLQQLSSASIEGLKYAYTRLTF